MYRSSPSKFYTRTNLSNYTSRTHQQMYLSERDPQYHILTPERPNISGNRSQNHAYLRLSPSSADRSPQRCIDRELDWRPRRHDHRDDQFTEFPRTTEDDATEESLIDLLKSQIARLLQENEKILCTLDDYRQQMVRMKRDHIESTPNISVEHMALQAELSESRMREAELTIAFGELHERIAAIDRLVEQDPEIKAFFNAVTISTTDATKQAESISKSPNRRGLETYSSNSPASDRRSSRGSMPGRRADRRADLSRRHTTSINYVMDYRMQKDIDIKTITTQQPQGRFYHNSDADQATTRNHCGMSNRPGLESPQSDSGCSSMNSHVTSDPIPEPIENEYDEDQTFNQSNTLSRLKRSQSNVTENSRNFPFITSVLEDDHLRQMDNTPTPTTDQHDYDETSKSQQRGAGRFSRWRNSFKQSFGLGTVEPDYRMEALAARQGEARTLLNLRETRMELLRVKSRCQTLQRHMERLEAINNSRMEELDVYVMSERELHCDIRNLQSRIFHLEAEHSEFKIQQGIHEMDLKSKLAEANDRLSQIDWSTHETNAWSELNKAHELAVGLLSPAPSQQSLCPLASGEEEVSPPCSDSTDYLCLASSGEQNVPADLFFVKNEGSVRHNVDTVISCTPVKPKIVQPKQTDCAEN